MYITHIDTACVLIEINGYRILTDPTLDHAGRWYHHGYGAVSKKTAGPSLPDNGIGKIDLVLLSHHQHKDNFDHAGRAFAQTVETVISTRNAAKAVNGVTGLDEWQSLSVNTPLVPGLKITATPAQHRPRWLPEFISGKVIGFIIEYDAQQSGVLYISGDTVYFRGIDEVALRYRIDTAILNVGGVEFRYLTGFGRYTMDAKGLLKCVQQLDPQRVIPVHRSGWTHFKESDHHFLEVVRGSELTRHRTIILQPGQRTLL